MLSIFLIPILCSCSAVVVSTENASTTISGSADTGNKAPSIAPLQIAAQSADKKTKYYKQTNLKYYLPKGVIHIDITNAKNDWTVKITPIYRPDLTGASYNFDTHDNQLFDDDTSIAIDSNGLLQTLNSSSTDETVSSISSLISAAASFLTFGASLAAGGGFHELDTTNLDVYSSYHKDFELDGGSTPITESFIVTTGDLTLPFKPTPTTAKFTIEIQPMFPQATESPKPNGRTIQPNSSGRLQLDGIVVREQVPYIVTVTQSNAHASPTKQQLYLMLPDVRHNYLFAINRRYLVTTSTKLGLSNGILTAVEKNKPSMVAGIVGVPKTLLGALAPIPLQVKQTQANYYQAIDNTLKAQSDIQKGQ